MKTTTEIFSSLFSSSLQSLKKEIDWDRADDKESASSDFRHPSLADLVSCVCVWNKGIDDDDDLSPFLYFIVLNTLE